MRLRPLLPSSLLALLLLSACTGHQQGPRTSPPDLATPLPATPENWGTPSPAPGVSALPDPWWRQFGDPRLDSLVERVLERNHDLAALATQLDAATAQARIAGAALNPQATAALNPARRRQNFIGLPIPGAGGVLSSTSRTIGATVNVSWEADLWGRLRAGERVAALEAAAAEEDVESARLSLAGQAAKVWFAAVETHEQLQLARDTQDNLQRSEDQIRRRFQRGLRSALDLRLAISSRATAEAAVAARSRQLDAIVRQAEILAGDYPGGTLVGFEATPLPALEAGPPAGLPAELLARRPDLRAAEHRLAAAGFAVDQARGALLPRLSLTGSAGRISEDLEDLLDADFSVWSLAANLLQPIFQGGRLRAAVDLADARQRGAAEQYVQAALSAFSEVETALAADAMLRARSESLLQAAQEAEAAREVAEDRYLAGLVDYLSVLETQRLAFSAQSQAIDARRQLLDNRIDLHLALGGGATLPTPPSLSESP